VDVKGEILELKEHDQYDVDQVEPPSLPKSRASPARWERRASLADRRRCRTFAGTWKDLTDNVNVMAVNLTEQVRGIVKVVTAVANGELNAEADGGMQRARSRHWPRRSTT